MLLKNTDQETVEQKQRRPDKYEEVVIIAAPVRDGDECSSVLCLITRPEDESLGENPVHSQVHQHHNQLINVQQLPQLMQGNVEQLTLKLSPTGKILSHDMSTLRPAFKSHLEEEPLNSLQDLCHYQDHHVLQKHLSDVLQTNEPHYAMYRLRLGSPDVYVHCKSQLKLWQGPEGDFIMAVHTILHDGDLTQHNLMGAGSSGSSNSSSNNVNNNNNSGTSTINGILMSPRIITNNNLQMMGSGPSGMMHSQQQQQQQQQMAGGLPNYFQQQNKMLANGGMINNNSNHNNTNNNNNNYGMGGPLMTSVINGGGSAQQQQQHALQNRNPIIKTDPNIFMTDMDLEILTSDPSFPFDMDFEPSPVSRSSLTPVNSSRPPSVSGVSYSPLPTPLTPYQMQQPNSGTSGGGGDPLMVSPNAGTGGQTPNTQTSGYGSTAGASSFSFPGFGDDSQGSSSGKDKLQLGRPSPQQQSMETTRLRSLLSTPGGSNAVSPPSASMGPKKGGGAKKHGANDARQANQILKVSGACRVVLIERFF